MIETSLHPDEKHPIQFTVKLTEEDARKLMDDLDGGSNTIRFKIDDEHSDRMVDELEQALEILRGTENVLEAMNDTA